MKSRIHYTCIACVCAVFGLSSMASGQRIVHVSPTEFGILNRVIANDTLGNGERVDPNTIYELERGPYAYYVLSSSIKNNGYHLTIVAEDGDGERPKIVPGVVSGGESSRCFRPSSDLTLKGLYVTNVDQSGAWFPKNIIRLQGEGIRLVVDDCHLDGDIQSHVRFDAHDQRVFITNSVLSNSLYNGRSLDRRGNRVDTLVVENCTFYNLISEVVREGDSGFVRYFKFNHNTVVNVGVEFCEIGETVTCIFTNNLIVNTGFFGDRTDTPGSNHILEIFPITSWQLAGLTQTIEFRNNNFYTDSEIIETQANLVLDGFEIRPLPMIDDVGNALVDTSQFIHERIPFTTGPSLDTTLNIIRVVWEDHDGDKDFASPFDNRNVGSFGEEGFGTVPFDFSYPASTLSYTSADGNLPLGDLNWFDIEISEGRKGDVDGNGDVDVLDVLSVVNHILGTVPITDPDALWRADCNDDDQVNVLDALGIVNVILGSGECASGN
ncbi:MAG: hypothetical protein JSV84_10480 [Gemmatimonadota bacterium]|nr:MAG: hypothetical protein JSV84_10480 [Gemmatimonadota bacterium]